MLGPFRKFSGSIYAKILMVVIIIPFVFWGMGSNFFGGNKNVIVVIEKDKYSNEEFGNYIQKMIGERNEIKPDEIEELLSAFISEKLIKK